MKLRIAVVGATALTCALVSACGSDGGSPVVEQHQPIQSLDTQQLLALAEQTSETATPFTVDGGYLVFTDTSDTTEPININAM